MEKNKVKVHVPRAGQWIATIQIVGQNESKPRLVTWPFWDSCNNRARPVVGKEELRCVVATRYHELLNLFSYHFSCRMLLIARSFLKLERAALEKGIVWSIDGFMLKWLFKNTIPLTDVSKTFKAQKKKSKILLQLTFTGIEGKE